MQLGLFSLLGLASNAVGLVQKAFSGNSKGGFDAELATAMNGTKDSRDALSRLLGAKDTMDEEALAALLSVPSGMLMFQFMTAMKEMGIEAPDIQLILGGSGSQLSDEALSCLLSGLGLADGEISAIMADAAGKSEIKARLGDSFRGLVDKLASMDGIEAGTIRRLTAADAATVEAIVERITSDRPFVQAGAPAAEGASAGEGSAVMVIAPAGEQAGLQTAAVLDMIKKDVPLATAEIRILLSHALKKALHPQAAAAEGKAPGEDPVTAIRVSEMVDAAGRDLGIPRDSLKKLFFETDPVLRQQTVEEVTSQVNTYLNSQEGRKLSAEASEVITFLKRAMSEEEFSGIDKTLKLLFPGQTVTDVKMPMDKAMYAALARNLAQDSTGNVFENQIKQVIDQLRQTVPSGLKNGEGQVTMKLHPPMLGRVDVDMTMHDGQLQATFKTDQLITRDIILQNITVLKEALADQGIKATQFSVMTAFDDRSPRDTHAFSGQERQGHGSGHHRHGSEDGGRGFREDDPAVYARANYTAGGLDRGLDLFA